MKRKDSFTEIGTSINFEHLGNLIYYKAHFDTYRHIDDLTTALSYETIVTICAKHLGIDESELLNKKGATKFNYHRHVFMGVLFLFSNMGYRDIAKKIGRQGKTIIDSTMVLSYYLETWREYGTASLRNAVKNILLECERESGGRITGNVKPKLSVYNKYEEKPLKITDERRESSFSVDEISGISVRSLDWFRNNKTKLYLTVVSLDGRYQSSIESQTYKQDEYLYLMQSFGYRFIDWQEHVTMNLEAAARINLRTMERLKRLTVSNSNNSVTSKCSGCIWGKQGLCPKTVQTSGFCPKIEANTPSLDEDGDRMKFIHTNDIKTMYLFNFQEQ
jgi:hypothetical protein